MIVKNEEDILARCLSSVQHLVDEIIIVDTGSSDRTKETARYFTDKIYDFEWINDFSAARNFAFSKATMQYQMWLDADDIFTEKDQVNFMELKKTLSPEIDIVLMKYNYVVDENNKPLYSFYRERLLKRENNYVWNDPVHEYITYGGNHIFSEIAVTHKKIGSSSDRNLKIYEEQIAQNKEMSPRALFYYARELRDHNMFDKAIIVFEKFLETKNASKENYTSAALEVGKIYNNLDLPEKALEYFFLTFKFDLPKAESCCEIAAIFQRNKNFSQAVFWYEFIFKLNSSEENSGFRIADCWNFIPCIELAVCYHNLGNLERAVFYNELAGQFKPNHSSVAYNREFFLQLNDS